MLKSIILDVDGTLWDSTDRVAEAWRDICAKEGAPAERITPERLKREFGKPMEDIASSLFPELSPEKTSDILKKACVFENDYLLRNPPPLYPGVRELLEELKARGIPAVIVSNCQAGYIEVLLSASGTGDLITGHLCPGDTGHTKAWNIREAIRRWSLVSPAYAGDTAGDAEATAEAGIPFLFASYGFGQVKNPDGVISKPLDILNFCGTV